MDIFFDENHDMTLLNRDIRFTTEDEDIKQRITIYLQFFLSEWFLDVSKGVPYTQIIFEAGKNDLQTVYAILRREVINIDGVETINSLTIDLNGDSRKLTVNLEVNGGIAVEVTI